MSKKLFIGGLSWNTTHSELEQAFEACGTVTKKRASSKDPAVSRRL